MKPQWIITWASVVTLAAGCTMTPEYRRPASPIPTDWPASVASPATTIGSGSPLPAWPDFFRAPQLQTLISIALTNNRDLRVAALNVERARALYGIQRAELFPVVDASGTGSKARVPADLSNSGRRQTVERYDANLGVASWEIDFFGRIRSLKDRALAEYFATEEARRSAQVLLISSVVQAYLALAADQENLTLARTTLTAQQATFDLVQRRHVLGLVPELEVFRAQTPLEVARRDVALYTQQVAKDFNALQLLLGAAPATEWLPTGWNPAPLLAPLSAGVSSEVLLARPDVRQAEQMLRAAAADIGAARAAFFPRISLTAAFGTASSDLSGLFESGSGAWKYAPQIVLPIFDARVWSAHRAARVQGQLAVAQYEQVVQAAFREVADALAVRATVDEEVAAQTALVQALRETYRLAGLRFAQGIDSYLGVLDAQRSLFAAQQVLVFLRLEQVTSQVRLYAVLGGGASNSPEIPAVAAARTTAAKTP